MKRIIVTISLFTLTTFNAVAANDNTTGNVPGTGAIRPGEVPAVTTMAQSSGSPNGNAAINQALTATNSPSASVEGGASTSSLSTSGSMDSTLSGGSNPSDTLGGPPNDGGTPKGSSSTPNASSGSPSKNASGSGPVSGTPAKR